MENDRELTETHTPRGAQAHGLRVKVLAALSLVAVFGAGMLLGRSRLAGSDSGEAQNAAESKPAGEAGERKPAADQVRLSPEAIELGRIEIGAVSTHSFRLTL
jgi:hypothetical protein